MSMPLLLLHEEALRLTHPVFKVAPAKTRSIYVWDESYLKSTGYTLKRLVFVYETLCDLPLEIIYGNTLDVIRSFMPTAIYVPSTNNPMILDLFAVLETAAPLIRVEDEPFVVIKKPYEARRFFQYWNKAERTAFIKNGGMHA